MHNVLYVEDDAMSREVLGMIADLNPGLMAVRTLPNSQDFEAYLLNGNPKPDIIFLDIHMAPIDGLEMLTIIRNHASFNDIPVVAVTASVMNEEIVLLQGAGFDSILAKPLDMDRFPENLNRILKGEMIWIF